MGFVQCAFTLQKFGAGLVMPPALAGAQQHIQQHGAPGQAGVLEVDGQGVLRGGFERLQERRVERVSGMKTYVPKRDEIQHDLWVVDAEGLTLGRLATEVATRLRGKHKPGFTPFLDTGDHVIVINASELQLTGGKMDGKIYDRDSGYQSGRYERTAREQLALDSTEMVLSAVRGMLPKTKLGRQMITKLKVYAGPDHPHQAQKPVPFEISQISQ